MRRVHMMLALTLLFAAWGVRDFMAGGGADSPASKAAPASAARSITAPCDTDLATLPEPYREMAMRMLSVPAEERPPLAICFTPDTDPEVVTRFNDIMASYTDALDYYVGGRWTTTANGSTGSQGNPATLTYSFVPDGVSIPGNAGEPSAPNILHATMQNRFGSATLWKQKIAQSFAQWEAITGVHYVEVSDDGAPFPGSAGQLGARGDVRIASHLIDGQYGILAYNFFPNTGDMVLDSGEPWGGSSNDYRFMRNIIMHEHGHGLGISHVCPTNQTKLMEPYLSLNFDGPQHDDSRAGQWNYGDRNENNDTYATATMLGAVSGTTTMNNVSSDNAADNDWYRFTVGTNSQVSATVAPVGNTYYSDQQSGGCSSGSNQLNTRDDQNLEVRLYGADGTTVLASATSAPAGSNETLPTTDVSPGTYYVRVSNTTSNNVVQIYNLSLTAGSGGGGGGGGGDPAPGIAVTTPNGGETWTVGGSVTVRWTSTDFSETVNVQLNRTYPTGTWETIGGGVANDGDHTWTVSGAASTTARVRVCGTTTTTVGDSSNANFTISGGTSSRTITVTAPNSSSDTLRLGSQATVRWSSTNLTGYVRVQLNRNYPNGAWETVAYYTPNDGVHTWNLSGAASNNARVRVRSTSYSTVSDDSDANFVVAPAGGGGGGGGGMLTVLYPNSGEGVTVGTSTVVRWNPAGVTGYVRIQVNRSYPGGTWENITGMTSNDGAYTWAVRGATSTRARIRVLSTSNAAIGDTSDVNFAIAAALIGGNNPADLSVPTEPYLSQNYPNPFNPSTMIEFGLPMAGRVKLSVYDITGREVAVLLDNDVAEGRHRINWSCSECAVGLYMIVLSGDNFRQVQKATFLK